MSYVVGKRLTAYPPRPNPEQGAGPVLTGAAAGLPHTGSVLTVLTGPEGWANADASVSYSYMWFISGSQAYASATNASYSLSAADAGKYVSVAVSCYNLDKVVYGTGVRVLATGTIIP